MSKEMIDQTAFAKACAAWDDWMSQPNEGVAGGLRAAIETYLAAATLGDHHVGLVLSNVMYKAQSRATQQRCVNAIADLRTAGCVFVQCPKGGSDA